jgi:hypothetical protein
MISGYQPYQFKKQQMFHVLSLSSSSDSDVLMVKVKVKVTLLLAVSQPVFLGVEPCSVAHDQMLLFVKAVTVCVCVTSSLMRGRVSHSPKVMVSYITTLHVHIIHSLSLSYTYCHVTECDYRRPLDW